MTLTQKEKEDKIARERERQATREWWGNPTASSTITWVHSGGERGVPASLAADWDVRMNLSTMANPANTTVNTMELENMDISLEDISVMEGDMDHLLDDDQSSNPRRDDIGRGKH